MGPLFVGPVGWVSQSPEAQVQAVQLSLQSWVESWHSVKRFERGRWPGSRWRGEEGQRPRSEQSSQVIATPSRSVGVLEW